MIRSPATCTDCADAARAAWEARDVRRLLDTPNNRRRARRAVDALERARARCVEVTGEHHTERMG